MDEIKTTKIGKHRCKVEEWLGIPLSDSIVGVEFEDGFVVFTIASPKQNTNGGVKQ